MIVKEVDVAYFNILCQHFSGITEENDKKLEKLFGLPQSGILIQAHPTHSSHFVTHGDI